MTLQGSGTITMGDIADEIGLSKSDLDLAGSANPAGATSNTPNPNGACFNEAWNAGSGNFGAGTSGVNKSQPHNMSEFYGYDHYAGFAAALSNKQENRKIGSQLNICTFSFGTTETLATFYTSFASAAIAGGTVYILNASVWTELNNVYSSISNVIEDTAFTDYFTYNASSIISGPVNC